MALRDEVEGSGEDDKKSEEAVSVLLVRYGKKKRHGKINENTSKEGRNC